MPPETVTEVPLRTRLPPGRAAPLPAVRLMPLPMLIWPLDWIASERPAVQPLSVRLPNLQAAIELDVYLAALAISTLIPIVLFLVFQGLFLRSAGLGGAVKG